ncbi:MAG: DeoR/GlpR transcriptional regulator, partial [Clostridia bacterium]
LEYELKRSVMAQCEQRILLIDREKFGKSALLTYAEIQSFHTVITEGLPDAEYCQALASYGVSLCTADRRGEET